MRRSLLGVSAAVLAIAAAGSAMAATTYSDRASFLAAVASPTTIDFNNGAPLNGIDYGPQGTFQGVTFASDSISELNPAFGALAAGAAFASDYLIWEGNVPQELLTVTFATPVTAMGFDFMEARGKIVPFTFAGAGLTTVVNSAADPSFFGIVSATPFSSFTAVIDMNPGPNAAFPTLDNFTFATALSGGAPEPASWALMLAGFALAGAALRSGRVRAATPTSYRVGTGVSPR
jgi:hypothetical protein